MSIYVQVAVTISLTCLGTGFSVDLGLKMPEVDIEAQAKYGTCSHSHLHSQNLTSVSRLHQSSLPQLRREGRLVRQYFCRCRYGFRGLQHDCVEESGSCQQAHL
jgi:hypothetical protein